MEWTSEQIFEEAERRVDAKIRARAQKRLYSQNNREKYSSYGKKRFAKKSAFLNWLKAIPCMDCGNTFPPECMDFDHRDRTLKKFNIGNNSGRSIENLQQEIIKCDLVCANCHRQRTFRKK